MSNHNQTHGIHIKYEYLVVADEEFRLTELASKKSPSLLEKFSEKLEALLNEKNVNAEAAAKLILSINFLIKHPFDFFGECENFHRTEIWGSNEGEIQYWYVTFYVNCDKIIFTIAPSQEGPEKWRNDIS